jgi:hypothetical protein
MKNVFKILSVALCAAALFGVSCNSNKADEPKYPANIANLRWDSGDYIRWEGDHSAFPVRKDNLNGWIVIIEPNGLHRPVEQIRPGYKRQHLKNAYGKDDYGLKNTKPGDTVQVYLCAMQANTRPDLSLRSNQLPLVWRAK